MVGRGYLLGFWLFSFLCIQGSVDSFFGFVCIWGWVQCEFLWVWYQGVWGVWGWRERVVCFVCVCVLLGFVCRGFQEGGIFCCFCFLGQGGGGWSVVWSCFWSCFCSFGFLFCCQWFFFVVIYLGVVWFWLWWWWWW